VPYHSIEDPAKLRRVLEATLLLESDLDVQVLLRHIIEEARSMTNARYGALGVLNEDRTALAEFMTSGLGADDEGRIGARPTGEGVLGLLITDPKPLRLARLGSHPDSYGFPPNHPPMSSFLGVPIQVRGEVYGNLYLTDKLGWSEFTADDEALVVALAVSAGIAIENARLHQRVKEAAVYEERDRLASDLHDTVIQRLFAVGLSLQSLVGSDSAAVMSEGLSGCISDLDDTIRQIRVSIFELTEASEGRGVRSNILSLVRELYPVVGFEVPLLFDGPIDTALAPEVAGHLLATIREALTNVGRHAQATTATVAVRVADGTCTLEVADNGIGAAGSKRRGVGLGLGNMERRAEKLHGTFTFESPDTGGTLLTWQVSLEP
jgi:signal transduction histidine kinase